MAISLTVQPTSIKGALSSMLYQAYDTDYAQPNFVYQYRIYVWSGTTTIPASPIAEINRLPDTYAGNRSWIDISKIVTQYISDNFLTIGASTSTIGSGAVYCAVKVNGFWGGGSSAPVTSNVILATKGYEYTLEGFNQATTKRVLTDRTTVYLTTETQYDYIWYDATKITSIVCGTSTITPTAVTNSSTYIQAVELKQLITAGGTWGSDINIVFNYSTGSETISVKFDCPNKYGTTTILFKNRYGVIEGYSFNAVSKVAMTTTKEEYYKGIYAQTNMAEAWTYGVGIKTPYNIQGVYKQLANTNWIPEAYVDYFQQLMLSSAVYVYYNAKTYACQIVDSAFDKKTAKNDKLIMYTFNFEYAEPLINSIVR